MSGEVYNNEQVAERLGISANTVRSGSRRENCQVTSFSDWHYPAVLSNFQARDTEQAIRSHRVGDRIGGVMNQITPRRPKKQHWEALRQEMHPMEFLGYWDVSRDELADILGCSIDTVNHWFSTGDSKRSPKPEYRKLLAYIHHRWLNIPWYR